MSVTISYLIRNRYDLIIMDSFSFQHSFVCFLHHFLLSSRIAAFHPIYRQLTLLYCHNSLELQRHQQLQSLTPLTHIPSHSHWSVHLSSSINTVELTVVFLSYVVLVNLMTYYIHDLELLSIFLNLDCQQNSSVLKTINYLKS